MPERVVDVFESAAADAAAGGFGEHVPIDALVMELFPAVTARQLWYLKAVLDAAGNPDPWLDAEQFGSLCRDGKALTQRAKQPDVPDYMLRPLLKLAEVSLAPPGEASGEGGLLDGGMMMGPLPLPAADAAPGKSI